MTVLEWEIGGEALVVPAPPPDVDAFDFEIALVQLLPKGHAWTLDVGDAPVVDEALAVRDFDGINNSIVWSSVQDMTGVSKTVSVWVRADTLDAVLSALFAVSDDYLLMVDDATGQIVVFERHASTSKQVRTSAGSFVAAEWLHVVVTDDGSATASNTRVFVNGVEQPYATQTDGTGGAIAQDGVWAVGDAAIPSREFDGRIADVRVWDRELSPAEVAQEFESTGSVTDGLVFAPDLETLVDPVSGLAGTPTGTTLVQLTPPPEEITFYRPPSEPFLGVLRALSKEPARVTNRVRDLLAEADPRTTTELLEDWERVYGLPEDCGTPPSTIEARRQALHAKMKAKDAGSILFFVGLAADLGYPSAEVIRLYDPFTCVSECTDDLWGVEGFWVNAFLMLPGATTENDGTLQCLVRQYAQAHEIPVFPSFSLYDGLIFAPDLETLVDPISGLTGTATGTTYVAEEESRTFDSASTDRLSWANVADFTAQAFTVSQWLYPTAFGSADTFFEIAVDGLSQSAVVLRFSGSSGAVELLHVSNSGTHTRRATAAVLSTGRWHHVAATKEASNLGAGIRLFVDGVEAAYVATTDGADLRAANGAWEIGNSIVASQAIDGRISDPRVYDRVLTPAEILELATGPESWVTPPETP